jgi:YD repeat-containing protein
VFNSAGYVIKDISDYAGSHQQETDYTRDPTTSLVTDVLDALIPQRDTHYMYNAAGDVTQVTNLYGTSNAVSTSYQYGIDDQLNQVTNGLNNTWTTSLDPNNGNALSMTDPLQHTWSATYKPSGQIATVTDPAAGTSGPLWTFSYNPTLDLQLIADRALETTSYQYDGMGRQTQVTTPSQETSTTQYDDKDEVTQVTDPDANTTKYQYNLNGNLNQLTDASLNKTTWSWSLPVTEDTWNVKECDQSGSCATYLMENTGGAIDQYTDKRGVLDASRTTT